MQKLNFVVEIQLEENENLEFLAAQASEFHGEIIPCMEDFSSPKDMNTIKNKFAAVFHDREDASEYSKMRRKQVKRNKKA